MSTLAPLPPLQLPGFPTTGPTGERDNLARLAVVMNATAPEGRRVVVNMAHGGGCPVGDGCTCDRVDVTLRLADARKS